MMDESFVNNTNITSGGSTVVVGAAAFRGERERMEDSHFVCSSEDYILFGVFDGHDAEDPTDAAVCNGGTFAVEMAREFPRVIAESLGRLSPLTSPEKVALAINQSFLSVETRARAKYCKKTSANMYGSTAVVVFVGPTFIVTAHVGDSRALLARRLASSGSSRIRVIRLTGRDHRPRDPSERLRIEAAGHSVLYNRVSGRLAMSRAMGDFGYKQGAPPHAVTAQPEISVTARIPERDQFLVLACDGVYDVFPNAAVVRFVAKCFDDDSAVVGPREAAEALAREAIRRRCGDNVSVVICKF